MNLQDMISKMSPQMLSQGLQRISGSLTPEQMREMEKAIKNFDKGELNQKLNALNTQDLQRELQRNPNIAIKLAINPELVKQLNSILNK